MRIVLLLTGLVLVAGIYILSSMTGSSQDTVLCAANIKITSQSEDRLTGTLENSTCPDYEGITIEAKDANGNFLFSDVAQMRVTIEDPVQGKTLQQTWKVVSAQKRDGDSIGRASFPALAVQTLQKHP